MTDKPISLFVLGMHRSGTSVVTGALGLAGYAHGREMMAPAEDNERGFFEVRRIVNLNDRMLDAVGMQWDKLKSLRDFKTGTPVELTEYLKPIFWKEIENAWDAEFGAARSHVVVKDPRFCLLSPLWEDAAKDAGFLPKKIVVQRSPEDVARSLAARNATDLSQAFELWLRYNLGALSYAGDDAPIIRYSEFVEDPISMLAQANLIDGEADHDDIRAFVNESISPELSPKRAFRPRATEQVLRIFEDRTSVPPLEEIQQVLNAVKHQIRAKDELTGNIYLVGTPEKSRPVAQSGERNVILHCHLFKNAGTSVDHILKSNFEDRWEEREFPTSDYASNADLVRTHLQSNTRLQAFSTHTGNWNLSFDIRNTNVFPIIFIRHPITRVLSAYRFEKKQDADTVGSRLAKESDFAGYINVRLGNPKDFAFKNFQSLRLAFFAGNSITNLETQAHEAFDQAPFIGSVESFDQSCERLDDYLRAHFPGFEAIATRKNVTDTKSTTLTEQLEKIREELGDELYTSLVDHNRLDLEIYERLQRIYG